MVSLRRSHVKTHARPPLALSASHERLVGAPGIADEVAARSTPAPNGVLADVALEVANAPHGVKALAAAVPIPPEIIPVPVILELLRMTAQCTMANATASARGI